MNLFAIIKSKLGAKLGRNVGSTLAAQGISWAAALAVTFFLPAYLGDTGLGTLTLATTFAGTLGVLINFGVSTVLVREIARRPENTFALIKTAFLLRVALGFAVTIVGIGAVYALGYAPDLRFLVILCLLTTVTGQFSDILQSALRGLEEFPAQNAAVLAEKLFVSGATIALVYAKAPIWSFIGLYFAGAAISSAICWRTLSVWKAKHTVRTIFPEADTEKLPADPLFPKNESDSFGNNDYFPRSDSDSLEKTGLPIGKTLLTGGKNEQTGVASPVSTMRNLALAGLPFVAAMFFVSVYGDGSAALLMEELSTREAIGWFGFAKRIAGAAQMIPVAVAGALLPVLSRLHSEGKTDEFAQIVRKMTVGMLVLALPFTVGLILAPGVILDILHYPPGYQNSIPVLRVTGAAMILWFLQQAIGTALIACDRQITFSRVTGIAALLAFPVSGAAIYLTERFMSNGAVGAVAAHALLEAYMLISYAIALPKGTLWGEKPGQQTVSQAGATAI